MAKLDEYRAAQAKRVQTERWIGNDRRFPVHPMPGEGYEMRIAIQARAGAMATFLGDAFAEAIQRMMPDIVENILAAARADEEAALAAALEEARAIIEEAAALAFKQRAASL